MLVGPIIWLNTASSSLFLISYEFGTKSLKFSFSLGSIRELPRSSSLSLPNHSIRTSPRPAAVQKNNKLSEEIILAQESSREVKFSVLGFGLHFLLSVPETHICEVECLYVFFLEFQSLYQSIGFSVEFMYLIL